MPVQYKSAYTVSDKKLTKYVFILRMGVETKQHLKYVGTSLILIHIFLVKLNIPPDLICFLLYHFCLRMLCVGVFQHHGTSSSSAESLFTKRTDALRQNPVKSRNREIRYYTFLVTLKFDKQLGSNAAELPAKYHSDMNIITSNLAASRLHEIWPKDVLPLSE